MRSILIAAAVLATLIAGSASADIIHNTSPLPARFILHAEGAIEQGGQRGLWFYGHTTDLKYLPGKGDEVLFSMHGFHGIQLVGLPPFLREVSTADGRLLRGVPQPGNYTVQMWRNGKHIPTLDMHIRFIPQ